MCRENDKTRILPSMSDLPFVLLNLCCELSVREMILYNNGVK